MEKKVTMNVFPKDKKLFKEVTSGLLALGDTEAQAFHKLLSDYHRIKRREKTVLK